MNKNTYSQYQVKKSRQSFEKGPVTSLDSEVYCTYHPPISCLLTYLSPLSNLSLIY